MFYTFWFPFDFVSAFEIFVCLSALALSCSELFFFSVQCLVIANFDFS